MTNIPPSRPSQTILRRASGLLCFLGFPPGGGRVPGRLLVELRLAGRAAKHVGVPSMPPRGSRPSFFHCEGLPLTWRRNSHASVGGPSRARLPGGGASNRPRRGNISIPVERGAAGARSRERSGKPAGRRHKSGRDREPLSRPEDERRDPEREEKNQRVAPSVLIGAVVATEVTDAAAVTRPPAREGYRADHSIGIGEERL